MSNNFFTNLYTKEQINKLSKKIDYLGSKNKINIDKFITIRIIISLILFLIPSMFGYWIEGLIFSVITYFIYEIVLLDLKINKRTLEIEEDSLFIFEMLYLEVDKTSSLKKSLSVIIENIDNELTDEIKVILDNLELGKSFKESVDASLKFIPSIHVRTVLNDLKDSYELGTPIKKTISNILDYLKEKTYYQKYEYVSKISIKFGLVTLLIYIPLIILLLISPYLVNLL